MHRKFLGNALLLALLLPTEIVAQVPVKQPTSPQTEIPQRQDFVARANTLLSQMTPEEKIGQLNVQLALGPSDSINEKIAAGEVGSLFFVTDAAKINALQKTAVEKSRLHIPLLFGFDVIHGFRTIFPVPIAMAASWDPAIVESAQATAAQEARAVGINWVFGPMVDIARDPRWGRMVEGSGEDPVLGSAMAAAQVRGFQGPYLGAPDHVLACVKHFAGYGAVEGGRDYESSDISDDQLWNVYFPPFQSAIDAGVGSLMSAYMDLNGVPATGNRWLLHDVLREKFGFRGFVVSDNLAVRDLKTHGYAKDLADAAYRALYAGVNIEMTIGKGAYQTSLADLLKQGIVSEQQLDDAVRPVLEAKFRLGLFEHPFVDEARANTVLTAPQHREQARKVAEHTMVLLKNEGSLLPLQIGKYKKIAVIGPLGDSQVDVNGSWAFGTNRAENITLLQGIKDSFGSSAEIQYLPGVQISRKYKSVVDGVVKAPKQVPWTSEQADSEISKAVSLASSSDIVIMTLGEAQDMTGEAASSSTLELPGREEELMEAIARAGKPIVLILMNGRPLNLTWAESHVQSILEAWYPGTRGGDAVADVLLGKVNPGGKLPFTWPRDVGQVPMFYAHDVTHAPGMQKVRYWNEESTPLYPFGYGLSYATFAFSELKLAQQSIKRGQAEELSVDVENTSGTAGDAVVQVYLHQKYGSSSRPIRELKAFQRVSLKAHEKRTLRFELSSKDLSYWSAATRSQIEDATSFDVWVGEDSTASLQSTFDVTQ